MIVLFTDFSLNGPYVGQMKSVIKAQSTQTVIIDLMHDAPTYNIRAAAYLLASVVHSFPKNTLFLSIVDPGVGSTQRKPCVVKTQDYWFVGPDNALFNRILLDATEVASWLIDWRPDKLSETFHGRDLFAPVAAQIEKTQSFNGSPYDMQIDKSQWPESLLEIIYCDHFGNLMTGVNADGVTESQCFRINGTRLEYARTFSEVEVGAAFWYVNSNNRVEFSVNQGRADEVLNASIGDAFELES